MKDTKLRQVKGLLKYNAEFGPASYALRCSGTGSRIWDIFRPDYTSTRLRALEQQLLGSGL